MKRSEKPTATLALSLISHTNVGKTTLARTLLRREVGEVADRPHVTDLSEAHELIRTRSGEIMVLWDTPGFGDTARLLKRLKEMSNPIGWFLATVWDRLRDRPLWCSQQAIKNIRNDADIVLYLVNASEAPESAGYVEAELELIAWLGKPTLALVNQTGAVTGNDLDEGMERWRRYFAQHDFVRGCLPLDAFARCWVQEQTLFRKVASIVREDKHELALRLAEAWQQANMVIFDHSMDSIARQLVLAASDEVVVENIGLVDRVRDFLLKVGMGTGGDKALGFRDRAMAELAERLDRNIRASMQEMIHLHSLEGGAAETILQRLRENYAMHEPIPPGIAAVLGGFVTGALGGLLADLAAGGLTFGGGAVAGGILGAAGAGTLAKGYNLVRGNANISIRWTDDFLLGLVQSAILRYLAVAHFGRGRGSWKESEAPVAWQQIVQSHLTKRKQSLTSAFAKARYDNPATAQALLIQEISGAVSEVLRELYPESSTAHIASVGGAS